MSDAVIYVRVSTNRQTVHSQLNPCREYCKQHNFTIVNEFVDEAKSAYHNVTRPGYDAIMELVRKREIQHIIVWALDRWTRQDAKAFMGTLTFLETYDVKLHSVKEYWIDDLHHLPAGMSDVVIPLIYNILSWVAHQESKRRSDRIKVSIPYKRAVREGRVGRPGLDDAVKQEIIKHLQQGKSYRWIHHHVTYKAKYGKIKHPSVGTITEISKTVHLTPI